MRLGIGKAKKLCDDGGDWERKNRLKVYEAVFLMATRSFKEAALLFLDSMATPMLMPTLSADLNASSTIV